MRLSSGIVGSALLMASALCGGVVAAPTLTDHSVACESATPTTLTLAATCGGPPMTVFGYNHGACFVGVRTVYAYSEYSYGALVDHVVHVPAGTPNIGQGVDSAFSYRGDTVTYTISGLEPGTDYNLAHFAVFGSVDCCENYAYTDTNNFITCTTSGGDLPSDDTYAEDSGTISLDFGLLDSIESDCDVTVALGGTASGAGVDYTTSVETTFTISTGDTAVPTQTIDLTSDDVAEADETIELSFTYSAACNIGTDPFVVTLTIDDSADRYQTPIADQTVDEDSGSVDLTVGIPFASDAECVFAVTTAGTATDDTDYSVGAMATIPAASLSTTLTVTLTSDDDFEHPYETIIVTLAPDAGCALAADADQTFTITLDDAADSELSVPADQTVLEEAGTVDLDLSISAALAVDCDLAITTGGTATAGTDYTDVAGTATIVTGSTTTTLSVALTSDDDFEDDETVEITVTPHVDCGVGTDPVTITLTIDDEADAPSHEVSCGVSTADAITVSASCLDYAQTNPLGSGSTGCLVARLDAADAVQDDFQLPAVIDFDASPNFNVGEDFDHTFSSLEANTDYQFVVYHIVTGGANGIAHHGGAITTCTTSLGADTIQVHASNSANAIAPDSVAPSVADGTHATTAADRALTLSFSVSNVFEDTVAVTAIEADNDAFTIDADLGDIAPSGELDFDLIFSGSAELGTFMTDVTIVSDGVPSEYTFRVLVAVEATPISQTSVSPENAVVNVVKDLPVLMTVEIVSIGDGDLDLDVGSSSDPILTLEDTDGVSAAMFSIVGMPQSTYLEPGEVTEFVLRYHPTAAGEHTVFAVLPRTNLNGDVLSIAISGSAVLEATASVAINGLVRNVYDAGVVDMVNGDSLAVTVAVEADGGLDINIASVTVVSGPVVIDTASVTDVAVPFGSSYSFTATLALVDGEYTEGEIQIALDGESPVKTVKIKAQGVGSTRLVVSSGTTTVSADSPLVLAPAVAGMTTARGSVSLANVGSSSLQIESVSLASPAASGLSVSLSADGATLAPGEQTSIAIVFAPQESQSEMTSQVVISIAGQSAPTMFTVVTSTAVLAWGDQVSLVDSQTVAEGSSIALPIVLPSVDVKAFDLIIVETGENTVTDTDFEIVIDRSSADATAVVIVTIVDDDEAEVAESLSFRLATSAPGLDTVTLTIPTNDQPTVQTSLDDDEEAVVIQVAGQKPSTAQTDGKASGSVSVTISRGDTVRTDGTSGGGNVVVRIVDNGALIDNDVDPNFESTVDDGTKYVTAGTSFAVDLDDGVVLANNIQVTATYDCSVDPSTLTLMLFDTERSPPTWVLADSKCTTAPAQQVVDTATCRATFTICHLTQFAVAAPSKADSTDDNAPSGVVSGSASGDDAADEDEGLSDGYIAIIVVAACLCIATVFVVFIVLKKKKKTASDPAPISSPVDDDVESGVSSAGLASSSASSASASSASASSASSASASASSASSA